MEKAGKWWIVMSCSISILHSFGHDYSFSFYNAKLIGSSKLLNLARTEIPPVLPDQNVHRSDLICFRCHKHLESLCQSNFHPALLILGNERLIGSAKVPCLCLKGIPKISWSTCWSASWPFQEQKYLLALSHWTLRPRMSLSLFTFRVVWTFSSEVTVNFSTKNGLVFAFCASFHFSRLFFQFQRSTVQRFLSQISGFQANLKRVMLLK